MDLAQQVSTKSKDIHTQVGAIAVDDFHRTLETGYNGFPMGVSDFSERMERPQKYLYTAHAEANLVATAARTRLLGATVYVTHLCCNECAKLLINAGVKKIVYGDGQTSMPEEKFRVACEMLAEAGVELISSNLNEVD